jgi:hypothetical protein
MNSNIPAVGSIVRVVTRHPSIHLFNKDRFEYFTFQGEVVNNQRWVSADSFSVKTGNVMYPVSIISSVNVHKLEILKGSKTLSSIRKFKVKGKHEYIVTLSGKNYSCSCVGFKFHSKCKHIEAVRDSIK